MVRKSHDSSPVLALLRASRALRERPRCSCGSPKCHPARVASILFRPRQNFEPAFDQELLWIAARALNPAILFPAAHTSTGRTHILRGDKRSSARPPDRNGGATHPVDSGKARDPRFGSEFFFP